MLFVYQLKQIWFSFSINNNPGN